MAERREVGEWTLHRRRIKTEEEQRVSLLIGGDEFIQFLAVLAVLTRTILNNRMNCTRMI